MAAARRQLRLATRSEREDQADETAADKGDDREQEGPAHGQQQEPEFADGEFADHVCRSSGANRSGRSARRCAWKPSDSARYMPVDDRSRTRRCGNCARRCVSATAVSSSAEITETTLEASMIRMNWLRQRREHGPQGRDENDEAEDLPAASGRARGRPRSGRRHRLDAGAHDLGGVGAEIDDHGEQRGLVRRGAGCRCDGRPR